MLAQSPKRPRDHNQLAKPVVDIAGHLFLIDWLNRSAVRAALYAILGTHDSRGESVMSESSHRPSRTSSAVDPDPFSIGLGLLEVLFAGATYLEARSQGMLRRGDGVDRFRQKWFSAQRTLINARRTVEEFSTYVQEYGYGDHVFLFGRVKLILNRGRVNQLRALQADILRTVIQMARNLDSLSEFLDDEYDPYIEAIRDRLDGVMLPETYNDAIFLVRESLALFEALINRADDREHFTQG